MKKHLFLTCGRAAWALGTALLFSAEALALQNIDVSDGRSHLVKISAKEMSRIAVDGGVKIRRIDFVDGELEVKKDDEVGDYYVLPLVPKPVNVFVKTASGSTHALILQPTDMPLETIILREPPKKENDPKRTNPNIERSGSLELSVKRLVAAMARGERPTEFDVTSPKKELNLWKEVRFVLLERYAGRALVGEHFRLTNVSKTVMRLAEQELYQQGVVAISIENQVLNPGESTEIFVTRVANDG